MSALRFLRQYFALIVVAAAFLWSVIVIAKYRQDRAPEGTITLRIAHWQLEPAVREAFEVMARDYRELHPNVRVLQESIPESTYGQWVSTQLMGGTAPDIIEIGVGLPPQIWVAYMGRYFLPLTPYVELPNPYNKGTEMEGHSLRSTFKDGMRNGYIEELQEFVKVALSQSGSRLFYNKDLLKKLTGLEKPPTEYRAFLAMCEQIAGQKDERGQKYIALAGSAYHYGMWDDRVFVPMTFNALSVVDLNRDGAADRDEVYTAFKTGRIGLEHPAYRARLQIAREVSQYFQEGYTGLTRDEAVFLFAQNRAVILPVGTWDARSIQMQAEGKFELDVVEYPAPAADDPEFGQFMIGPRYERLATVFPFGVTQTSAHPEVAIDFLLFLASQKQNEKLNGIIGWLPAIKGTEIEPFLQAFDPNLEGIYSAIDLNVGGETLLKWQQLYSLYQVNQISLDDLTEEFNEFMRDRGTIDFAERVNTWVRDSHRYEQMLAGLRARAMFAPAEKAESEWLRYRVATGSRQIGSKVGRSRALERVQKPSPIGPYDYKPEALANIRQRLEAEMNQESRP